MTLTPTTAAQLRRLSQLTGNSQASLISELLEGQEMVFDRVIQALEAAALVKEEMKSSLREDLDRSQQVIEAQLGLVLESLDNASAPLLKEAEKIRRRKGRETGGGGQAQRRTPAAGGPYSLIHGNKSRKTGEGEGRRRRVDGPTGQLRIEEAGHGKSHRKPA